RSGVPTTRAEFMLGNRRYCYPPTITDFASRYPLACETNAMIADGLVDSSAVPGFKAIRSVLDWFAPERTAEAIGVSAVTVHGVTRRFARRGASLALGGGMAATGDREA